MVKLRVTDGVAFTPTSTGTITFTMTGTIDAGCSNTASVDLIVNDLPAVTASASSDEICLGETIIFTSGGADSYLLNGGIIDGHVFTPLIAETRTYTVTRTNTLTGG